MSTSRLATAALALALACGRAPSEPATAPAAPAVPAATPRPRHAVAAPAPAPAAPACPDAGVGPEPDGPGLQSFVKHRAKRIRACYASALKRDPGLQGKLLVSFDVDPCGRIADVRISGHRGAASGFAACLAAELRVGRTPFRPAAPVPVEYPLRLSAL